MNYPENKTTTTKTQEAKMEYEELKLDEIRSAARHFIPETRGDQGIAKRGSKEELIAEMYEVKKGK